MKINFADTETTGLDPDKGHRICEIAIISIEVDPVTKSIVKLNPSLSSLVNPLRAMPAEVTAIHGITTEMVLHGPTFRSLAKDISSILENGLFVAHNAPFDLKFIEAEFGMSRVAPMPNMAGVFDSCEEMRVVTPEGKMPKLGELCWAYNIPYGNSKAHRATYDTKCMLHAVMKAWKHGDIDLLSYVETTKLKEVA